MCVSNSLIVWQKPPMLNNRVFSLFPISLHLIMGKRYLSRIRTCSVMPSTSRVANCYPKPPGVYLRLTHIIKGLKNAATACVLKQESAHNLPPCPVCEMMVESVMRTAVSYTGQGNNLCHLIAADNLVMHEVGLGTFL